MQNERKNLDITNLLIPKRDLPNLLNAIASLKSAIKFKLTIESQIAIIKKLIRINSKPFFYEYLLMLISPNKFRQLKLERSLENDKLTLEIEVKEKTSKIYHSKELSIEESLKPLYKAMEERYEHYIHLLQSILSEDFEEIPFKVKEEFPGQDISFLLSSIRVSPPTNDLDKLSLFLSMEETLLRSKQ